MALLSRRHDWVRRESACLHRRFGSAALRGQRLNYDATVRNLEIIGEAATHIPQHIRDTAPHIPWRTIIATRNRLIHGYLGIDNDMLWSIIQTDIPGLLLDLHRLKDSLKTEDFSLRSK